MSPWPLCNSAASCGRKHGTPNTTMPILDDQVDYMAQTLLSHMKLLSAVHPGTLASQRRFKTTCMRTIFDPKDISKQYASTQCCTQKRIQSIVHLYALASPIYFRSLIIRTFLHPNFWSKAMFIRTLLHPKNISEQCASAYPCFKAMIIHALLHPKIFQSHVHPYTLASKRLCIDGTESHL